MYGSLPTEPDETPTPIFNPSKDDFIDQIAIPEGTTKALILPSRVITMFPRYIADHIAKHLARKLALEEENRLHFEDKYNKWIERIYIRV